MEPEFRFDHTYLQYYQGRLERASDGTRVPGLEVIAPLIEQLQIKQGERVLDVGCSFGRLLPLITPFTSEAFGLEMSYDVVDVAARHEYRCVVRGSAEDSNLPSGFFSHLVLFGVFDCCNQRRTLREVRRLLAPGGRALLTGKNATYHPDDRLALIAERNAWRKRFPNSFTFADSLSVLLPKFGLELVQLQRFARRGDFGEQRMLPASVTTEAAFYEYTAIVRSSGRPPEAKELATPEVSAALSRTAQSAAQTLGYATAAELFESGHLDDTVASGGR
jgi:SAM-dependent methyltransferase